MGLPGEAMEHARNRQQHRQQQPGGPQPSPHSSDGHPQPTPALPTACPRTRRCKQQSQHRCKTGRPKKPTPSLPALSPNPCASNKGNSRGLRVVRVEYNSDQQHDGLLACLTFEDSVGQPAVVCVGLPPCCFFFFALLLCDHHTNCDTNTDTNNDNNRGQLQTANAPGMEWYRNDQL
eukprot:m.250693 g.250693  ORF g.250693 m.250693 type:complete len:177 (-) comp19101_c0_seq1:1169-1699(-)